MTAQHPDWDKLWKQIQYLLQHNPAWLRKNINRRVKQIVRSARIQQRQTNPTSKHPGWNEVREKVQNRDRYWLRGYAKSHDINQCQDEHGNTLLHAAVCDDDLCAILCLSDLCIDPNIKNAAGQTALQLAPNTRPVCIMALHKYHLCIDFAKASSEPNGLDALFAAIYRGDATLGDTSGVKNKGNEKNAGGWTALHCAVMYDRPHLICELHQRFPKLDANCLNYDKCSALRLALMRSHSNCITALSECFPAIKAGDELHAACKYNRSTRIPTLCKYFPQLNGNEFAHSSALMCAVRHNNPECIRALHSCFPDIDPNLQDEDDNTALFAAVKRPQNSNCISVLSECFPNIDPNKQDNDGNTALMHACKKRFSLSVILLATYFPSIDINMRDKEGKTTLMLAIQYNCHEKCIVTLCESFPNLDPNIQDKSGQTALMFAVLQDNPGPIISQLHKFFPDIDPNAQDKSGQTALILATSRCQPGPIISQLHKFFPNIDPNVQEGNGDTALMNAVDHSNPEPIISQLLKCFPNLDPNAQNQSGQTALMIAARQYKAKPILSQLLKCSPNIDPNVQDKSGKTALMIIAYRHSNPVPIMSQLHEVFPDIDPNKQDDDKDTVLMYLLKTYSCSVEYIRHFLDTFPNVGVNIQNAKGETAWTIAIEKGKGLIVDLLLERFPDILSLTNSVGRTALMLEIKKNRINLISMFLKHIAQMQ